jgi:hypothetical protein
MVTKKRMSVDDGAGADGNESSQAHSMPRRAPGTLFFVPAIAGLNRLSYAGKFLIVGLLLLAPFGYVTTS